jgi:hypothetical protein
VAQSRPGSTVAGRYRLDDPRPADLPGAERWSATDTILARPVTVTLVSGPRAGAVLDAARRAALVVDPRLTRILDVGTADGDAYVVTAAVAGRSLASLAARAPLAADQARAVVGEAAAALETARRRGVHHLALRPEVVMLTSAGRVVLEGLAVDGELLGAAGGSAHAMSRADTVGLVRVLYAALTGRWPAAATAAAPAVPSFADWSADRGARGAGPAGATAVDTGLAAAPEHDGAPLPPVDLVASVPADLDTLCAVTLGPHDDGPHSPGELVRELEPWRAVRADEIFRAADAGRWPALPDQPADAAASTAPPTGSSPMSDDQTRTTAPDGAAPTPAGGTPGARGAGAAGAGAAGAGVAGAGVAGAAAAAAAGAAAATPVARQSVRSVFSGPQGPGTRRPGTPPPATPSGSSSASFPSATAPARTSTRPTPAVGPSSGSAPAGSVPPARSGSPAEPAAPASPAVPTAPAAGAADGALPPAFPPGTEPTPPAIPPASGRSSTAPATAATATAATRTADTGAAAAGLATSGAATPGTGMPEVGTPEVGTPGTGTDAVPAQDDPADLAVAGITGAGTDADRADEAVEDPAEEPAEDPATPPAAPARRTSVFTARGAAVTTGAAAAEADAAARTVDPAPPARPAPVVPEPAAAGDGADGPGHPAWNLPFPAEQPPESLTQRRFDPTRWVLGAVAVAVVVGVVIAIGNVLAPFRSSDEDAQSAPVATASAPPAEAPAEGEPPADGGEEAPATAPPAIASVTSIDPSDGDGEHEELVGRITDGDPATTWYTHTYNRPDYAGFKDAVGLAITLQAPATVSTITIDGLGTGGNVEVRSTDAANPTAGDVLAGGALAAPQTVLTLAQPTETQSIVLWFTSLSQTPDGANKIELSNIAVS